MGSVLVVGMLAGCGAETAPVSPEAEAKEIPIGDAAVVDTPEEQLFTDAKRYYATELYSVSKDSFRSLGTSYALGAYAEFAEIKAADSNFELREYETAGQLYEDLIKNRPASRAMPYLLLRVGRSYELAHRGAGRDQGKLEKALEHYDNLLKRFPNSVYAAAATAFRRSVVEQIATAEGMVRDFYRKRDNEKAAVAREEIIEKKWAPLLLAQNTPAGVTRDIQTSASRDAVQVLVAPVKPSVVGVGTAEAGGESSGALRITNATCSSAGLQTAYLYLNRDLSAAERTALLQSQPESGPTGISVQIAGVGGLALEVDCFGSKDLRIAAGGQVKLSSRGTAKLLALERPARIAIVVR